MTLAPRILCYSHDTYGLGHFRRNLLLTEFFSSHCPQRPAVLLATGSTRAGSFPMPPGVDTLKLPCVIKHRDGSYTPRTLEGSLDEVLALRGRLLVAAIAAFQPHFVLVDHVPAGLLGELRGALRHLSGLPARPQLLLGLRDVIDSAPRTLEDWRRDGVDDVLPLYDRIFVYGDERVGTTAQELGLTRKLPGKVLHTGYLARPVTRHPATPTPTVVVTAGGGGDGHTILRAYAEFLEAERGTLPFHSLVVAGPLLSGRRLDELRMRFAAVRQPVTFTDFVPDMHQQIANASAVISMAGYNTVAEILAAGTPALLIPRDGPREEQILRAQRMAERGSCRMLRLAATNPVSIGDFLEDALSGRWRPTAAPRMDGCERVCTEMAALAEDLLAGAARPVART